MNKSKFLKKSLAALLAILMVAAMIPLSAAAEVIGNGETITATTGTLSKGEDDYHWTVTLPYTAGVTSTTITLASDRKNVEFVQITDEGENSLSTGTSCSLDVKDVAVDAPKEVTIELRDQAPEEDADPLLATYYVTVDKEATSADTTVTGATIDLTVGKAPSGTEVRTYTGVVEGTTITFNNIPWGRVPTSLAATSTGTNVGALKITMAHPHEDLDGAISSTTTTDPFYVDATNLASKKTLDLHVSAQNGNTAVYTVKFNEATSFTGITVAGVAAVQDTTDPTKWTVTVDPEDVDENSDNVTFKAAAPKTIKKIGVDETNSAGAISDLAATTTDSVTKAMSAIGNGIAAKTTYYVAIEDNKGNQATCSVDVTPAKNSDTGIKAFTVSNGTYTETGNVDTMTVTMPSTTTDATLAAGQATQGVLAITFKGKMQKVTLNGTALNYVDLDNSDTVTAVTSGTMFTVATNGPVSPATDVVTPLKTKGNTLVVVAEDGTQKTYNLNVDVDKNQTANPQIIGATITLGTDKEEISAKTIDQTNHKIVFEIPASLAIDTIVTQAAVEAINWRVTTHSTTESSPGTSSFVKLANGTAATVSMYEKGGNTAYASYITNTDKELYTDDKDGTQDNTTKVNNADICHAISVKSDGHAAVAYKVYIEKVAANAVTRLTNIKFYDATSESEVTADNTYEGKPNDVAGTVTIGKTLPYSLYDTPATGDMAISYTLGGSRAKLYYTKDSTGIKIYPLDVSGFDKKGRPQAKVAKADMDDILKFVVISEAGEVSLANNSATITTGVTYDATLQGKIGANNYKEYDFKTTLGDASTLNQLISLKSADGAVVGSINGFNVNLVVPPTYVVKDSETEFDLVAEVSENATVTGADLEDPITFENVKVLQNTDGTYSVSHTAFTNSKLVVNAQNGTVANYAVSVTVAELDGNADVSSITANGVAATEGEDDAWTVELPYGTDLEAVEVAATPASDKATPAVVKNDDGTYTITVTAERGNIKTYTLTVTVADKPAAPEFDDVPTWAQDAVGKAAEMGWMVGTGNNKFSPSGEIRRGDFALTIARILEEDWANVSADYAKDVFTDVKEGDWYYEAVAYAVEKGIMNGRGNGFDPRTGITREEAAKVMCLAKGLDPVEGETTFGDNASIAGWAKPYVKACQDAGIFNGTNGNFNPKGKLSRAETAQVLVNAFYESEPAE